MKYDPLKIIAPATLLFLIFALYTPSVFAKTKTLQVGTSTGYPPFYYMEEGDLKGICIDVIAEVFKKMKLTPSYRQLSWKRMLLAGQKKSVDAVMPLFKTKEREKFLYFHRNQIAFETNQLFVRHDSEISKFAPGEDFSEHSVGVISGYSYGSQFEKINFIKKIAVHRESDILRMVRASRISMGIGNKNVLLYHVKKIGFTPDQFKFLSPNVTEEPLFIGFTHKKGHQKLSQQFSKILSQFKRTTKYRNILEKY